MLLIRVMNVGVLHIGEGYKMSCIFTKQKHLYTKTKYTLSKLSIDLLINMYRYIHTSFYLLLL